MGLSDTDEWMLPTPTRALTDCSDTVKLSIGVRVARLRCGGSGRAGGSSGASGGSTVLADGAVVNLARASQSGPCDLVGVGFEEEVPDERTSPSASASKVWQQQAS